MSVSLDLDGGRYLLVHATPREPLYRAVGPDPAAWAAELEGVDAETVLVGHTHVPFHLALGTHRVVNPGSVGLPMDGDPRAAYALLEGGAITPRHKMYPIERTIAALRRSGLDPRVIDELALWLRTGQPPRRRRPTRKNSRWSTRDLAGVISRPRQDLRYAAFQGELHRPRSASRVRPHGGLSTRWQPRS